MAGQVDTLEPFLIVIDLVTSAAMITVLFALMFKFLPDVEIAWRDVWFGAFVTAVLFVIGKFGIGLYLSTSEVGSAYGAAGSLIIILAWIYYSALILFFGAELTQAWATAQGRSPDPKAEAPARGGGVEIPARQTWETARDLWHSARGCPSRSFLMCLPASPLG